MDFILIYITNPTKQEAIKTVEYLLEKRLIACGNIFESNSLYWWKNKIANEKEFVLIAKTLDKNFDKIKKEVEKIHSYSIPCIIKIPASLNGKYFEWVKDEIQ